MKFILFLAFFSTFASAQSILSVKERLRLHLWTYGLEDRQIKKMPVRRLPEEIERPLRKL